MLKPPRADALILIAAAALLGWQAAGVWSSVVDDAYISARYALELASGNGLTYSPGEPPVEGVTNLAFTGLLAAAMAVGVHPLDALTGWGGVFAFLTLPLLWLVTRTLSGRDTPLNALPALLWAALPHAAIVASNGLETTMMVATTLATLLAWTLATGPTRWILGAFGALLVWVRPEGLAVCGVLGLIELLSPHRATTGVVDRVRALLSFAIPVALSQATLLAWRWVTFNDVVPNTWHAKADFPLTETFRENGQLFTPETPTLVTMVAAFTLGALISPKSRATAGAVAVGLTLGLIPLTVQEWMPGLRLMQPTIVLACCLVGASLSRLPRRAAVVATIAVLLGEGWLVSVMQRHTLNYDNHHTVHPGNGAELAAQHLAAHLPPGATVAIRDAGNFAFWVGPNAQIFELHQRALTRPHPEGKDAFILQYTPQNPDVVVTTLRDANQPTMEYPQDKRIFDRLSEPYTYLGRVEQHYRRHYDVYVRAALGVPPLPEQVVVNRLGVQVGARNSTPRPQPADPGSP